MGEVTNPIDALLPHRWAPPGSTIRTESRALARCDNRALTRVGILTYPPEQEQRRVKAGSITMSASHLRRAAIAAACLLAATASGAGSGAHHCASISSADLRALCRAITERASHHCASISGSDQRAMCRAQVEGRSHHCAAISDADSRAYCRAITGG